MSDSAPRRAPVGRHTYVDYETGMEVTDAQYQRIEKVLDAVETLYIAMHDADGSTLPGEHQEHVWSGRRMAIAATHIETALFFAKRACLEAK